MMHTPWYIWKGFVYDDDTDEIVDEYLYVSKYARNYLDQIVAGGFEKQASAWNKLQEMYEDNDV